MTIVVITGRRMKSDEVFMAPSAPRRQRLLDHDLGTRHEADLTVGDDGVPARQPRIDHGVALVTARDGDRPQIDGAVGLDDEHVVALLAGLHRARPEPRRDRALRPG